jgi:hypothetical protein
MTVENGWAEETLNLVCTVRRRGAEAIGWKDMVTKKCQLSSSVTRRKEKRKRAAVTMKAIDTNTQN